MEYDYVVTLKNDRVKMLDTISRLVVAVSILFFARQMISGSHTYILIISSSLISAGLIWNWYSSVKKQKLVYYSRVLLVAGVTWLTMPMLAWIGLPIIALGLLEKLAKSPVEVGFRNEHIILNTLFKRKYLWNEFNNIILKDNILTLDLKNNKVLQKETLDDDSDADEDEFNAYCQQRLFLATENQVPGL